MAAITHIGHDPLGFPKPLLATVKLAAFLVVLLVLLLGVPAAAMLGLYHFAT